MKQMSCISNVALLLLMLALPAAAAGPIFIENPIPPFDIPAGVGCAFDVQLTPEAGKPNGGEIIGFANGNAMFAGPTFVTLTNTSNGKSINLNISGPAKFIFATNIAVNEGPTLFVGFPPPAPPKLQGLVLGNGRTVTQFDSSGNIISVSFVGTTQNVCPLLE